MHLRGDDAVVRDHGAPLAGFADDFDGQTRAGAWDIGADEFVAACSGDLQCDDGVACTDDKCVAGSCLNADACGAGRVCRVETGACEATTTSGPPVPKIVTVDPVRSD